MSNYFCINHCALLKKCKNVKHFYTTTLIHIELLLQIILNPVVVHYTIFLDWKKSSVFHFVTKEADSLSFSFTIFSFYLFQKMLRLRFGIDRPTNQTAVTDYVLDKFSSSEKELLPSLLDECAQVVLKRIKEQTIKWKTGPELMQVLDHAGEHGGWMVRVRIPRLERCVVNSLGWAQAVPVGCILEQDACFSPNCLTIPRCKWDAVWGHMNTVLNALDTMWA